MDPSDPRRELETAREALKRFGENLQAPRSVWGPHVWAALHHIVRAIPCPDCRMEGEMLIEGIHDIVNEHIGKPLHSPRSLCMLEHQARKALIQAGETRCGIVRGVYE